MTGFKIVNLSSLVDVCGEDAAKGILSEFQCPYNTDVEKFLRVKAIEFAKHGWSRTHLVFASYKQKPVLVGYFTLSNKIITIGTDKKMGTNLRRRINAFATYNRDIKKYWMTAPLIGQLGKNFANDYNTLITGDELLFMACEKIKSIQIDIGGKFTYLECEDKPVLVEFYQRNGFYNFGKRFLENDEKGDFDTPYLIQLIKYLK